ncbi:MAG: hypothetical protein LBV17_05910 [Treponema sp.]|jgi:hypothetical protein|nr:hypothetical protein [Treponema sp.]
MQVISCDICKKKMDNPVTDRTFYYIGGYGLCEACKDNLEYSIKPTIRNKEPFSMEWYRKILGDSLEKATQKGRI